MRSFGWSAVVAVGSPVPPRLQPQRLAHARHDVRLRDRLATADRERAVRVGVLDQVRRHETLARDLPHRLEHALGP